MPRVAYFPDSFHEVNGVAHTSRNFLAFAQRQQIPFLCVRAGGRAQALEVNGDLWTLELGRSNMSIPMEQDLAFDTLFFRYRKLISKTIRDFRPDVIHITGPSELGMFGAYFAWRLKVPLVASWHTNVHEYAGRRMGWAPAWAQQASEAFVLYATSRFYRFAKVLYAPNPGLCALLERKTSRPCHLMQRGVDTDLFNPAKRTRPANDGKLVPAEGKLVLGYVGRLSVEKNVALLPIIDRELRAKGISAEWLIVGHGAEEAALRAGLQGHATFAGVLRGEALAEAYANMDLLVFPSHTDTFGNVVLEALASGVPAIVTPNGGPASIVRDNITGRIAEDAAFTDAILSAANNQPMRQAARNHALGCSWDAVFERVIAAYPLTK